MQSLCQSLVTILRRSNNWRNQAITLTEDCSGYQDVTGLGVSDMIAVFKLPGWRRQYGGSKWVRIAETLRDLISALDAVDLVAASRISDSVSSLNHNSGPLVPTRLAWETQAYLREKWPELCD